MDEPLDPLALWAKDYATSPKFQAASPDEQAAVKKAFFKKYILPTSGLENMEKAALDFKFSTEAPEKFYTNPEFLKLDKGARGEVLVKNIKARGLDPFKKEGFLGKPLWRQEYDKFESDPRIKKMNLDANIAAFGSPMRGLQQTIASTFGLEKSAKKLADETAEVRQMQEYFPDAKATEMVSQVGTLAAPVSRIVKGGQILTNMGKSLGPVIKTIKDIGVWLGGSIGAGTTTAVTENVNVPSTATPEQALETTQSEKLKAGAVNTMIAGAPEAAFGGYKAGKTLLQGTQDRAAYSMMNTTERMAPIDNVDPNYVPNRLTELETKLRGSESTALTPVTAESKELGALANSGKFYQSPEAVAKGTADAKMLKQGIGEKKIAPQSDVTPQIDTRTANIQVGAENTQTAAKEAIATKYEKANKELFNTLRAKEYKTPAGTRERLARDLAKAVNESTNPQEVMKIPGMSGFVRLKGGKYTPILIGKKALNLGDLVETRRLIKKEYNKDNLSSIYGDFKRVDAVFDERIKGAAPEEVQKRLAEVDKQYIKNLKLEQDEVRNAEVLTEQSISRAKSFDQRPVEQVLAGSNRDSKSVVDSVIGKDAAERNLDDLTPEAKFEVRNSILEDMQSTLDKTGKFERPDLAAFNARYNSPKAIKTVEKALKDDPEALKSFKDTLKLADEADKEITYIKDAKKAVEPTNTQDLVKGAALLAGGRPSIVGAAILNWRNALSRDFGEYTASVIKGGKAANEAAADLAATAKKKYLGKTRDEKAFNTVATPFKSVAPAAFSTQENFPEDKKGILENPDVPATPLPTKQEVEPTPEPEALLPNRSSEDTQWAAKLVGIESSFGKNKKAFDGEGADGFAQFFPAAKADVEKRAGRKFNYRDPKDSMEAALVYRDINKERLQDLNPNDDDLYAAHFLGDKGFRKLKTQGKNAVSAAKILPEAASNNKKIFYDNKGKQRTPAQVLQFLKKQFSSYEKGAKEYLQSFNQTPAESAPEEDAIYFDSEGNEINV